MIADLTRADLTLWGAPTYTRFRALGVSLVAPVLTEHGSGLSFDGTPGLPPRGAPV